LFGIFFFDDAIKTPTDLVNRTKLPLLGHLNMLDGPVDFKKLWDVENRDKMKIFKELVRSIRFEIDRELNGKKVIGVTSLEPGEGKTLLSISLAYSYSMINKKVLLIDGNFNNPTISDNVQSQIYLESYFQNTPEKAVVLANSINVIVNHGGDVTLLEISDENFIHDRFAEMKDNYDIIIIETPALSSLSQSKEWLLFTDKVVAVFGAGKSINKPQHRNIEYLKSINEKFGGWVLNRTILNEDDV
jgi:succinoglycan biosynthesis transport protein ExoP